MGDIIGSDGWKSLLGRARGALDDQGWSDYTKRVAAMERKIARHKEATGSSKLPYDFWMVQEVLVEYDKTGSFKGAVKACGGNEAEVIEARQWSADIRLAYDFVWERLRERMRLRARDIAVAAQDGLERSVTDERCRPNVKALELALERTVPELYGDPQKHNSGRGSGAQVVYNLPGLTVNLITPPKALERKGGEVIEAEEVS